MALTHLVDTSVLTRLRSQPVYQAVASLLRDSAVGRAEISDLELGFTARNAREWDEIQADLVPFGMVKTDSSHVARALRVQRALADRRQRGRKVPDLIVAAAAESAGLVLMHYDSDFDLIAAITGQPCEWVVPRGTID